MKEYIEIGKHEFLIEYYETARKENGEILWKDGRESIAYMKNRVREVVLLYPLEDDKVLSIKLDPSIFNKILERLNDIETREVEPSFWD